LKTAKAANVDTCLALAFFGKNLSIAARRPKPRI
jgi:hypothetical protein